MARRTLLTGTIAVTAALSGSTMAFAAPGARPRATANRVAVLGGGVGGLTAAHELAERGFAVTVYERKALGGKARSIPVPGTATGGRLDLPGEHGFRFFPGFYQNIPDTMSRIPFSGNAGGVRDNLVNAADEMGAWNGKTFELPTAGSLEGNFTPQALLEYLKLLATVTGAIPLAEIAVFGSKILTLLTSGPKRRLGQWENTSYADFIVAAKMSENYRTVMVDLLTSTLVAAKPDKANTRTMGLMAEAWLYSSLGLGGYGSPDRLLSAPTSEAWIDPWVSHLSSLGVGFRTATVTELTYGSGRITGARALDAAGAATTIEADWYVLAVPVERAVPMLGPQLLAADPRLARLKNLTTSWMNGVMIYTTRPVAINNGHVGYPGQPWALTSISQGQFWRKNFAASYGDGTVVDCLSIDLSNWDAPGILYGKAARDCTPDQIIAEVLAQLRKALPNGDSLLPDSIIHSWFIDPAITGAGTPGVVNDEPLLINTPSSWQNRPDAVTAVPNLFLAADYVRTDINLATMEGANEAGRAAANGVLAGSGSSAAPAKLFKLYAPPEIKLFWDVDDFRYLIGLPNQFDLLYPAWP
jgi:uncharacterized protein with NAD-binding domain and iron-sulfur cluster